MHLKKAFPRLSRRQPEGVWGRLQNRGRDAARRRAQHPVCWESQAGRARPPALGAQAPLCRASWRPLPGRAASTRAWAVPPRDQPRFLVPKRRREPFSRLLGVMLPEHHECDHGASGGPGHLREPRPASLQGDCPPWALRSGTLEPKAQSLTEPASNPSERRAGSCPGVPQAMGRCPRPPQQSRRLVRSSEPSARLRTSRDHR